MRISDRPERGVAHGSDINFQPDVPAELSYVMETEPHDEIVRMLPVDDGLPVGSFSSLEEQRIAAISDGGRLQAQHQIHLERAVLASAMFRRSHEPIGGIELVASARPGLLRVH